MGIFGNTPIDRVDKSGTKKRPFDATSCIYIYFVHFKYKEGLAMDVNAAQPLLSISRTS